MKSKKIKTPTLVNAAEMAKQHPETFEVPPAEQLLALKTGDIVKVSSGFERFWTVIIEAAHPMFKGEVNSPVLDRSLKYGTHFAFHSDNIYSVWEGHVHKA